MKRRPTTIQLPAVDLRAEVDAASLDTEARTVDAVFYTGAEVIRAPMFDEPYFLSFSMEPGAADLSRLNSGAAVVDSHSEYTLDDVLGKTSDARLEDGAYRVRLHFSVRDERRAGIWQDVQEGLLRNLSMRATINDLEELGEDEATGLARYQASKWGVSHIALLATGADAGAAISLSDESAKVACNVHYRAKAPAAAHVKESSMNIKVRLLADCEAGKKGEILEIDESDFDLKLHTTELEIATRVVTEAPKSEDDEARARKIDAALAADKKHKEDLKRVASNFGCDELWVQRHHNLGTDIDDAIADASAERAKRSPVGPHSIGFGNDYEAAEFKIDAMAEALAARARGVEPAEHAKQFYGMGFAELAVQALALRGKARGMDSRRDAWRLFSPDLALHTTSDFPLLLANALNKTLLPAYQLAQPTYRQLAQQRTFNDYRPHPFARAGDFPQLLETNEHGEFKYGTMGENSESVTAVNYGRIIGLTKQTLVNDDLGAFADLAMKAAMRVADFENTTFFTICILAGAGLGPDLSDTDPVYDANHSNLGTTGLPSVDSIGEARALLRKQTSIDGLKLNTPARILLVSPDHETLAEQLTAPLSQLVGQGAVAAPASNVNPFAGRLTPVADANLTGDRWYLLADPAILANYVYGYIGGASGPMTSVRQGFETNGVEFKVELDFGCGAIDYRGGVTNQGS